MSDTPKAKPVVPGQDILKQGSKTRTSNAHNRHANGKWYGDRQKQLLQKDGLWEKYIPVPRVPPPPAPPAPHVAQNVVDPLELVRERAREGARQREAARLAAAHRQAQQAENVRELQSRNTPQVHAPAVLGPGINLGSGRKKKGKGKMVGGGAQIKLAVMPNRIGVAMHGMGKHARTLDGMPIHVPYQLGGNGYEMMKQRRNWIGEKVSY